MTRNSLALNSWNVPLMQRNHNTDLVSIMGLVGEAKGHAEGVVMVLQQRVSVVALVQSGDGFLDLLQPRGQVLLGTPPTGQVSLHHPTHSEVVSHICTLGEKRFNSNFRFTVV